MIKREELSSPSSCMSRAREDEMTFVLLARDAAATAAILAWIKERIRLGRNQPGAAQLNEAYACIDAMVAYRLRSAAQAALEINDGPCVGEEPGE